MADATSRKIKLVYDVIRAITNVDHNIVVLKKKIQMLIDNGFSSGGSDPLTDEILAAEPDLAYLTYEDFAEAKDASDAFQTLYDDNNREIGIIMNKLQSLTGK